MSISYHHSISIDIEHDIITICSRRCCRFIIHILFSINGFVCLLFANINTIIANFGTSWGLVGRWSDNEVTLIQGVFVSAVADVAHPFVIENARVVNF